MQHMTQVYTSIIIRKRKTQLLGRAYYTIEFLTDKFTVTEYTDVIDPTLK